MENQRETSPKVDLVFGEWYAAKYHSMNTPAGSTLASRSATEPETSSESSETFEAERMEMELAVAEIYRAMNEALREEDATAIRDVLERLRGAVTGME